MSVIIDTEIWKQYSSYTIRIPRELRSERKLIAKVMCGGNRDSIGARCNETSLAVTALRRNVRIPIEYQHETILAFLASRPIDMRGSTQDKRFLDKWLGKETDVSDAL